MQKLFIVVAVAAEPLPVWTPFLQEYQMIHWKNGKKSKGELAMESFRTEPSICRLKREQFDRKTYNQCN